MATECEAFGASSTWQGSQHADTHYQQLSLSGLMWCLNTIMQQLPAMP
jgi:hypothetical protein